MQMHHNHLREFKENCAWIWGCIKESICSAEKGNKTTSVIKMEKEKNILTLVVKNIEAKPM